ncbi:MAG TPA: NAD-dependent protein deacylase [Phycisphaerales bacterium]|nr:NAD-dependent protein deacylase [Phycisphaerales bacterium]HRQ74389.1 NAD-dependent protein deacylase [Phycisphaerales bacterium]
MSGAISDSLERARRRIHDAAYCVSFSGAGLSAESGVATFRDPDGLWAKHDPMRLASPEGFADDPQTVIEWYAHRRRTIARAQPNAAHRSLARVTGMIHITQNVDDLLQRAGAWPVIQLHGTITRDHCHACCGMSELIDLNHPPPLRMCSRCGARMRPSVVWFGEALPNEAWREAESACTRCDVMLVIGTSAAVYPAAGLIGIARSTGAFIIVVNTNASGASGLADIELIGPAGEIVPRLLP